MRKVLIVEDSLDLAEVIAATLERIDFHTILVTHVSHALTQYYQERPDLILLDIGLPDRSGWKLLDEIRLMEPENQPIVVVITAHGDPANRLMGKLQGVHSYLVKPFTADEIRQVVLRAIGGQRPQVAHDVGNAE
ncbi:MAG: response regulator [Anaerolineae bacterium]